MAQGASPERQQFHGKPSHNFAAIDLNGTQQLRQYLRIDSCKNYLFGRAQYIGGFELGGWIPASVAVCNGIPVDLPHSLQDALQSGGFAHRRAIHPGMRQMA